MKIRLLKQSDIEGVQSLINNIMIEHGHIPLSEDLDPDLFAMDYYVSLRKNHNRLWVLLTDTNRVVGTIASQHIDDSSTKLGRFYIDPDYRTQGFGRKLYGKFYQYILQQHYKKIYCATSQANKSMIFFLEKKGFKKLDKPVWFSKRSDLFYFFEI